MELRLLVFDLPLRHTDAALRVDANCASTAAETIANSRAMKELGVEFIEQPLPAEDLAGMESVFRESVLPVIADESCGVRLLEPGREILPPAS